MFDEVAGMELEAPIMITPTASLGLSNCRVIIIGAPVAVPVPLTL